MVTKVGINNSISFIPGIINLTVVQNTGGAFSILKEYPVLFKVISVINFLVFLYLLFCPTVNFNTITKIGCACILGSTLGNLIDRFSTNGVIDFIDIQLFHFAIFNLADVFINIGVGLILIGWLRTELKGRDILRHVPTNNET